MIGQRSVSKGEFIELACENINLVDMLRGLSRRDLYQIIFDRLPERGWEINLASTLNETATPDLLYDFLYSEENKTLGEIVFAKTFAQSGIEVFIHIPKTAGSSVNVLCSEQATVLTGACSKIEKLFQLYMERGTRNIRIVLSGHRSISLYSEHINLAGSDRIVTVIRDPIDLAVSYYNFAVSMAESNDPEWGRSYLDHVDKWKLSGTSHDQWFINYIDSAFFDEALKNIYYQYLGDKADSPSDVRSIISNLLRVGAVIVKPEKVNLFFGGGEGVAEVRENVSNKYISRSSLNFDTKLHLRKALASSVEFYALLDSFEEWTSHGIVDFKRLN